MAFAPAGLTGVTFVLQTTTKTFIISVMKYHYGKGKLNKNDTLTHKISLNDFKIRKMTIHCIKLNAILLEHMMSSMTDVAYR